MKALVIQDLRKTYSSGFQALKGINLSIEQGEFFALLGPNGAGKTTMIGIMSSLVNKSQGEVLIFGHAIDREPTIAKKFIGLVPQEFNFSLFDRVIDIVVNQAGYYGIARSVALERAQYYLMQLGLWDKRYEAARVLSGGMKRRLMIARALIHEPKILILDEPTAGVDIELRRSMWDFLRQINQAGTTIVLTTHYLEEAESLCQRVAIIDHGMIIKDTSLKNILTELHTETIVLDVQDVLRDVPEFPGCTMRLLDEKTIEIQFKKTQTLNHLFQQFSEKNIQVTSMRNKTNRLEELFIHLVQPAKSVL